MASEAPRHRRYARENVRFFVEEMIWYIMRRNGIDLELRRPEHLERLRAVALHSFSPSIGDAVICVGLEQRERVLAEVRHIWNYVRTLRRRVRGEVLQCSLVIMGMRVLNEGNDPNNIFLLMAIVAHLSILFCRDDHPSLIGYAVTALEYILNHTIRGGFPRTLIRITTLALRMRILNPTIVG